MTAASQPHASGTEHPAPARTRVSAAALWFGIAGGPAAWSVQTLVNLAVSSHGCFPRLAPLNEPIISVRAIALAVSVLALVVCVAAMIVAGRSWLRTRTERHQGTGKDAQHAPPTALLETGEGRTRFMALSGVLASVTFFTISVAHAAVVFLVVPCARP